MKNKINFLWNTALSMLDLGSSLIYNLLGRNLDATDIELIEKLFTHMSTLKPIEDEHNLAKFIKFEQDNSQDIINLIERLNKGKDILLITNKSNGYNILQLSVINLLSYSFNLFDFDDPLDVASHNSLFNARLNIVKYLLAYGCDPNRGLVFLNKKKFTINTDLNETRITAGSDLLDSSIDDNEQSENQTVITTLQTIIQNNKTDKLEENGSVKSLSSLVITNMSKTMSLDKGLLNTPMDTPLLLVCCLYSCHNLIDYHCLTSTEQKNEVKHSKNKSNLFSNNSSSSSLSTCLSIDQNKLKKRRHTIHSVKECNKPALTNRKTGSISINSLRCEEKLEWPSLSIDKFSSTDSSASSIKQDNESSIESSNSKSVGYSTSSISSFSGSEHSSASSTSFSSSYFQEIDIHVDHTNDENDNSVLSPENNKTFNSVNHYESSEFSDYLEDENDDEYIKSNNDASNIYNYDFDHDDQNYYDKYEYDIDSKCCKLFSNELDTMTGSITHQQFNNIMLTENDSSIDNELANKKVSSLSTSIFSIPSSSVQAGDITRTNSTDDRPSNSDLIKLTELARVNFRQRYIHEKLNRQRLELLDLLLDHGADKYLVAKISDSNLKRLNKKTANMLKKWFSNDLNNNDEYSETNSKSDLRPFSPIMASICLDDVEVFSRLYKHHQVLSNYFKPDEDYELIYYAIRFQSKKCLIYLLSHSNMDEISCMNSAVKISLSLPSSLNKATNATMSLNQKSFDKINKNINTMFYILENTRSSKIISVLLKCGFDLCKREPFTGNTSLHCLFNANSFDNRLDGLKSYGTDSPNYLKKSNHDLLNSLSKRHKILKEYNTPHSLSKILFKLLKHGGLKAFVNTQNYENKLCMQVLFEWDELIETVFFQQNDSALNVMQWKHEFEECVRLLLKSGADLFTTSSDDTEINCISSLITSILKNTSSVSVDQNEVDEMRNNIQKQRKVQWLDSKSPSSLLECNTSFVSKEKANLISPTSRSSQIFATAKELLRKTTVSNMTQSVPSADQVTIKKFDTNKLKRQSQLNKRIDIKFLYHLLNHVIDLPIVISNLNRKKFHYYHHDNDANIHINRNNYVPGESLISKYLEILQNVNLDDFETAFKTFKILCRLEKQLISYNNKKKVLNYVSPQLIKNLITNWILNPSLFSSSRQYDKNHFVKSIIVHLIANDMYDPNDCSTVYNAEHCLVSNNLLNHCVRLILKSKTGYQLELIYDLMRTLIQYGANPNLEPYELVEKNFFNNFNYEGSNQSDCVNHHNRHHNSPKPIKSNCILAQLCECNKLTPALSPFNLKRNDHHHHTRHCQEQIRRNSSSQLTGSFTMPQICEANTSSESFYNHTDIIHNHHHHSHHHHHYHHQNNYFNDYFNNKYYSLIKPDEYPNKYCSELKRHELSHKNLKHSSLNPILLLTPSPSYESLISLPCGNTNSIPASSSTSPLISNNIIIDKSILFLNHYKKFVKLLYDSMDNNTIKQCLKHKKSQYRHYSFIRNHNKDSYSLTNNLDSIEQIESLKHSSEDQTKSLKLYSIESLDMYLERLASTPRTLKSIVRRHILNRLIEIQKPGKTQQDKNKELTTIAQQVSQLPLPKRIMDYLLFIE